jgi:hypothetical protein
MLILLIIYCITVLIHVYTCYKTKTIIFKDKGTIILFIPIINTVLLFVMIINGVLKNIK